MNDLDNDIRKALASENGEQFYNLDREQGLRDMIIDAFRGKKRWMAFVAWVNVFVFSALAVFVAVKFFKADSVQEWILYATLFLTASMIVSLTKIWFCMFLNRNSVQREIKRLELRIVELNSNREK